MPIEIRMPRLASDMESADVVTWLVEPGERIERGDVLLELETEKSTVEFEAPSSGVLTEILVPAGTQDVEVGRVLAMLEAEETAAQPPAASADPAPAEADAPTPPSATTPTESSVATSAKPSAPIATSTSTTAPGETAAPATPVSAAPADGADVPATALARRLADRAGLDLRGVQGSGARGRITRIDVEGSLEADASAVESSSGERTAASSADAATRVPHSRMRRTIAARLAEAKRTIPHFYLHVDCQVDALLEARRRINEPGDVRVSVNDFIVRAAALALREVPEANVSWSEEALIQHASVDVAIAVATEGGLITPILREADRKALAALSAETRALAERARAGRLAPTEYQGGSISVSNLGMYGVDSVYPIVNPPQSCILGVGQASARPVVRDGEVAAGTVMTLTLCADHRSVDGAVGARLLAAIRRRVEQPLEMML